MNQISLGLNLSTKKTRKCEFLDEMGSVVPWKALVQIIDPYWPKSNTGRPLFAVETMLRIHYMQQVRSEGLSDGKSVARCAVVLGFTQLTLGATRVPDESTILRFRHLLGKRKKTVVVSAHAWR